MSKPAKVWRHQTVNPEVFDSPKETVRQAVQKRARASFYNGLHELERIANGEAVSTSTSTTESPDGKVTTTVTKSLPSAKDRIAAITALGRYGGMEPSKDGDHDLQAMVRALVAALREPGVRDFLLSDPANVETLRLLSAEPVEHVVTDIPPEQV